MDQYESVRSFQLRRLERQLEALDDTLDNLRRLEAVARRPLGAEAYARAGELLDLLVSEAAALSDPRSWGEPCSTV